MRRRHLTFHLSVFTFHLISCQKGLDLTLTRKMADGTYFAYFPSAILTEESKMTPYHKKLISWEKGCRCVLDKEIAPDGTYITYFPFGAMIERTQMRPYHKKLLDTYAIKDEIYILEIVLEGEALI